MNNNHMPSWFRILMLWEIIGVAYCMLKEVMLFSFLENFS